jgi:hypothetical protein
MGEVGTPYSLNVNILGKAAMLHFALAPFCSWGCANSACRLLDIAVLPPFYGWGLANSIFLQTCRFGYPQAPIDCKLSSSLRKLNIAPQWTPSFLQTSSICSLLISVSHNFILPVTQAQSPGVIPDALSYTLLQFYLQLYLQNTSTIWPHFLSPSSPPIWLY